MLYYAGEWYWGLDRLDHLERRLQSERRALTLDGVQFDRTWQSFCQLPAPETAPEATELEVFFSIRSPYSHLGLQRAMQLAEHYHLPLRLRPVLPMLMRGLPVPPTKKWYIFHDTKREADKLGIPYGKVADPLGAGVERCYQLFAWAQAQGQGLAYLHSVSLGVNSQGLDAANDRHLRQMVERAGLSWAHAQSLLGQQDWRAWAQDNLDALREAGLWGVPSFRYGDLCFWGQDRLGLLEQALRRRWHLTAPADAP
nr:DsbA family protein [Atopomonas sediminilitoris]